MNEKNAGIHNFHFIIDKKMRKELMGLKIPGQIRSFSGLIVKIMDILLPRIEGEFLWGKERENIYKLVNDDMNVVRENVHVYMPQKMYRRFKMMHDGLNVYSMAQLMRFFLGLFLRLVRVYGENFICGLKKLLNKWKKKNKSALMTEKKMIQLCSFLLKNQNNYTLLTIYNPYFSPKIKFPL